ncbi:hypothetical protein CALVIDRAFT_380969 [Calocera viscosa TUFC12733]|uniref:Uncharacterized protein n=1 Tax=Calocera viscosa (strain TUFC12733) TaxID=1330018 RepID=A0A167Q5B6_CALVF|nr:hypothetical protein CALVIDRAFT_380969 [Calocera viscosa TUFC12733]
MTLLSLSHTTSQAGSGEARTSGSPTEVAWSILWPSAPPASASKDMRFSSCYSGFAETKHNLSLLNWTHTGTRMMLILHFHLCRSTSFPSGFPILVHPSASSFPPYTACTPRPPYTPPTAKSYWNPLLISALVPLLIPAGICPPSSSNPARPPSPERSSSAARCAASSSARVGRGGMGGVFVAGEAALGEAEDVVEAAVRGEELLGEAVAEEVEEAARRRALIEGLTLLAAAVASMMRLLYISNFRLCSQCCQSQCRRRNGGQRSVDHRLCRAC